MPVDQMNPRKTRIGAKSRCWWDCGSDYNSWFSSVLFPLTLTLSLGEREHGSKRFDQPMIFGVSNHGSRFSLSSGERVGVRGREVSEESIVR